MKISSAFLVLLTAGAYGVAATEALYTATVDYNEDGGALAPQENRGGWVNPEDLPSMPQCVAQQHQYVWLSAMTRCTGKLCTHHFGPFCTHHQWLTQLSCLSTEFSSGVIRYYLPYCSRSILAKAQLYRWVREITGRTWLVDIGDANGLENLSPASLTKGYATTDVTYKAPTCLTSSVSAISMEPFQLVIASCSFTSTTQHTGNAARPWEYSQSRRSMIALDFETVGYDLFWHYYLFWRYIRDGNYFDIKCFCSTFTLDLKQESCSGLGLDLTKELLWINAICGSKSLPDNWTKGLKTTEFAYIPIEDWHWPKHIADIPKQLTELTDQCETDACEVDSSGYCKVKRAVDRACFCRSISYDSCRGSCQIFETRIGYIKWLHGLCGNVQDWHGLPDNWRQLAAPTPLEMIPWQWSLKPSNNSIDRSGSIDATEVCASNEWKLESFALVNIATFLVTFLIHRIACGFLWHSDSWGWFSKGIFIAALQLLANWFNAFLIQKTPGYENVPVNQLMLLWCSMPRLAWLMTPLIGVRPINFSTTASSLFAEMILQLLTSYYMIMTFNYGLEHNFYFGGIEGAERGGLAKIMYAGALMWLIVMSLVFIHLNWGIRRINRSTEPGSLDLPNWQRAKHKTSNIAEELMAELNERCVGMIENLAHYLMDDSRSSEQTPLMSGEGANYTVYGTVPVKSKNNWVPPKTSVELYAVTVISVLPLWITQWIFLYGFIGLSSEEFCPPKLGVLMAVWITFSLASAIFGATR